MRRLAALQEIESEPNQLDFNINPDALNYNLSEYSAKPIRMESNGIELVISADITPDTQQSLTDDIRRMSNPKISQQSFNDIKRMSNPNVPNLFTQRTGEQNEGELFSPGPNAFQRKNMYKQKPAQKPKDDRIE